ncbi:MAG: GNAT family N-acetyltransferase [Lachnospiraceae bacterium]|nr:GNAT family N-acetyltransferase [Lachnospiraceae bacterium]
MNELEKIYTEEDLFPREVTSWEERGYGILFFNEENRDSYDSNHAIIFKEKVSDVAQVLKDIVSFYSEKGIHSSIYQSIRDEGYFEEIKSELFACGFESWTESQKYMVLTAENTIVPSPKVDVQRVSEWDEAYAVEIFEKAEEPWEIDVARRVLGNSNTLFFVAFYQGNPVGMTYGHIRDGICRVDYLLVSKECRNMGVGRALIHSFVEYCHTNQIQNCYLWPDGETAERIYYEAGFRHVETRLAGRASYIGNRRSNT